MTSAQAICPTTDGANDLALLTSAVARILGVSPDRVRMLERTGQLRAERTEGGVRIFHRADVMRLKVEREQRRAAVTAQVPSALEDPHVAHRA